MGMSVKLSVSATELCCVTIKRKSMLFLLRLPFVLGWVDINRVLAIAVPNRRQQFAVGLEFTESGKKKKCQPLFTSSFCVTLHVDYSSRISLRHVDPLSIESVSAEKVCTVPSPFSRFTALPFVVCFTNAQHKSNWNCFSNTWERTATIAFQSQTKRLVLPTKPVIMLHRVGFCVW